MATLCKYFKLHRLRYTIITFFRAQIVTSDTHILLVAYVYISFLWQIAAGLLHALHLYTARTSTNDQAPGRVMGLRTRFEAHIRSYGGYVIFGFMVARLVGSLSLLYLSAITTGRSCQSIALGFESLVITFVSVYPVLH